MFFKTIESENRLRAFYGAILIVVGIGLSAVSVYMLNDFVETVKQEILLAESLSNEKDAEAINV